MIRILHFVHALTRGGGLSNFIMNYYRNIDRSKIQFDFVFFKKTENDFIEEIKELGGNVFEWTEPSLNLKFRKQAEEFFNEHAKEYVAIHCHVLFAAAAYGKIAKKYGLKVIAHSHNTHYGVKGFTRKLRNYFFVKAASKNSDYKLACSKAAAIFMFGKRAFENGRVLIISNAIDCEKFFFNKNIRSKIRKEYSIQDNSIVIGHVGGFALQKNHSFLIDAFNEYHKKNPNSILMLVGGNGITYGSTYPSIKKKVLDLGIDQSVIFTGLKPNVNELMMAMDAFAFPSIAEGFGIVLVEAQASGLPCVVSTTVPKDAVCTELVIFKETNNHLEWANTLPVSFGNRLVDKDGFKGFDIKIQKKNLEDLYIGILASE